ncbi:MAG: hypothetical protein ACFE75_13985 [Candidatus Hodarchaeota archaeon]
MNNWLKKLEYDPLSSLSSTKNKAIQYFIKRDLLEEEIEPIETIWEELYAQKIIRKQLVDGSWKPTGKPSQYNENRHLWMVFKSLRELIPKYCLNKKHKCIRKAAEFIFRCQTEEGDIRGIYANQYMPNYMGALMELLNKAEFHDDQRIEKGFQWFLSMRHMDGGWGLPMLTKSLNLLEIYALPEPISPDKTKPSSHWLTGMVLRAFAAHPKYKNCKEAKEAGNLLISRFFQRDKYSSRQDKSYWFKFYIPFFWTDLLSALDTVSKLGFSKDEPKIKEGLQYFIKEQQSDGHWDLHFMMMKNDPDNSYWFDLEVCRVFKRFYN